MERVESQLFISKELTVFVSSSRSKRLRLGHKESAGIEEIQKVKPLVKSILLSHRLLKTFFRFPAVVSIIKGLLTTSVHCARKTARQEWV